MAVINNTTYQKTVDSLSTGFKSLLNNPYYLYNNYSPTIVTYYSINKNETTLDYSLKTSYAVVGNNSPIKYNKINQFILYGIEKIQLNLENGDQGLESSDITGDCYFLPNTITPSAGDFFVIAQLKEKFLFVVESVNKDTMDNEANFFKATYRLEQFKEDEITPQVVKEYTLVLDNSEGSFSTLIEQNSLYTINELEFIKNKLQTIYLSYFYNERVQTFTYRLNGKDMYDEYLIEFIIRNKLLKEVREYVYVDHKTTLDTLFPIYYDKTIFSSIENIKEIKHYVAKGEYIEEVTSIFQQRYEDYFKINHILKEKDFIQDPRGNFTFEIVPKLLIDLIEKNEKLTLEYLDSNSLDDDYIEFRYMNIIVDYMNNNEISKETIEELKNIEIDYNRYYFYIIPIILYIINSFTKSLKNS